MFIGRESELRDLQAEIAKDRASLVVAYGRRRVGKSALLQEATRGRPIIFYQATRVASSLNLAALKEEIQRSLGTDPLVEGIGDWLGILHYLASAARRSPGLVVVLDEFPYLVDVDAPLPSIIQKFWDSGAANESKLKLILCGSMIAQMEDLLAEKNPLYGRKTMSLELEPLPLRDASKFFPGYSADDLVLVHAIFGGIPYYLQLCDPKASLEDNVVHLLLGSTAPLIDEPMNLLQSELRDVQRYSSIISAVADGCTKSSEIIGRVKEVPDSRALSPYLDKLFRMHLIRPTRSMDATERERDRRYFLSDPLMAFWYRFVRPNLSSVTRGFGRDVYRHQIVPMLDEYMGWQFEVICREHVRRHVQERASSPAQEVGQIWNADYDIDIAGRLLDGAMIYGECKWWIDPVGENVLTTLTDRAGITVYGKGVGSRYLVLYSRKGFTSDLRARADRDPSILLYTPETMLEGNGSSSVALPKSKRVKKPRSSKPRMKSGKR